MFGISWSDVAGVLGFVVFPAFLALWIFCEIVLAWRHRRRGR